MKKTLLAQGVMRLRSCLIASAAVWAAGVQAAQPYGQVPQSRPRVSTKASYAPIPPSYAQAAATGITNPRASSPSRPLEAKVDQLAQNDRRQDVRLHHLEREVGSLAPASHRPATDIQGEFSSAGPPGKLYTVRSGDTLWRIAAKYSTSINAIRAANRMSGDTVATGQTLMIPGGEHLPSSPASPGIHVVSPGETFSGVAQTYRVTQDALARANPSAYPDRLLIGERLIIPGARSVTVPDYAPVINPPSSIASRAPNHTVREGESLGAIAKKYGVSTARLAAANKLKNPNLVEVGQQLVVPSATAPTSMSLPSSKLVMHSHSAPDVETIPLPGAGLATLNRPSVPALAPMPAPAPPKLPSLAPVYPPSAPVSKPAMPTGPHRGVVAYRLERGDDLSTVANMFSTTPAKIRELNMLAANTELKAGDEVVVPALGPVSVD